MNIAGTCVLAGVVWLGVTGALSGCGAETGQPQPGVAPQVDPRFATAESLLEYYNQLATADLIDFQSVADLYCAEAVRQQPWRKWIQLMVPVLEMEQEIWSRFERSAEEPEPSPWGLRQPAQMIEREEHRAKARFRKARNRQGDVYFVKIGDRWWVSCYTLEYDPDLKKTVAEHGLTRMERDAHYAGRMAKAVLARLRAGEFKSAKEAFAAFEGGLTIP